MAEITRDDEELLLASMKSRKRDGETRALPNEIVEAPVVKPKGVDLEPTPTKDSVQRKRKKSDKYNDSFLKKNEIKDRHCIYISKNVYAKVSKIVKVIADNDISIGGYVDTVLLNHFEEHKDEINGMYKQQREDLI